MPRISLVGYLVGHRQQTIMPVLELHVCCKEIRLLLLVEVHASRGGCATSRVDLQWCCYSTSPLITLHMYESHDTQLSKACIDEQQLELFREGRVRRSIEMTMTSLQLPSYPCFERIDFAVSRKDRISCTVSRHHSCLICRLG